MRVRKRPCEECPWVRSTPAGQFPAERYDALRTTTGSRMREVGVNAPLFACHKSASGRELPCAGWLAAVGYESLRVRRLLASGEIPPEAMTPGEDWPELFDTYEAMASTQARRGDRMAETQQEKVAALMDAGRTPGEIAAELGIDIAKVYAAQYRIRQQRGVRARPTDGRRKRPTKRTTKRTTKRSVSVSPNGRVEASGDTIAAVARSIDERIALAQQELVALERARDALAELRALPPLSEAP